jgi:hypothetical protein
MANTPIHSPDCTEVGVELGSGEGLDTLAGARYSTSRAGGLDTLASSLFDHGGRRGLLQQGGHERLDAMGELALAGIRRVKSV